MIVALETRAASLLSQTGSVIDKYKSIEMETGVFNIFSILKVERMEVQREALSMYTGVYYITE